MQDPEAHFAKILLDNQLTIWMKEIAVSNLKPFSPQRKKLGELIEQRKIRFQKLFEKY